MRKDWFEDHQPRYSIFWNIGARSRTDMHSAKISAHLFAAIIGINQYGALLEQVTVLFEDQVECGVQERVTGADEGCWRLTVHSNQFFFKDNALVGTQNGCPGIGEMMASADTGRNMRNLVAFGFALV